MWHLIRDAADTFALRGEGYQFWSGIGSGSPLLAAVYLGYRHHNCHTPRCPRLRQGHGDFCRRHG